MSHVVVDKYYCKGCQRCIANCKKGCLELSGLTNDQGYEYVKAKDDSECVACGICYLVCPDVAITVYKDVKEA